ncbi:MAG: rubrerythrin family protein, partial [Clostridia bacterium]|nr:rubrerythrin family protein [Clostridia bacterium]
LITVALMVIPYLLLDNVYVALGVMLAIVVLIILVFNYYISVAKNLPFKKRFLEMVVISLSVAAISFVIGLLVKRFLGIDV